MLWGEIGAGEHVKGGVAPERRRDDRGDIRRVRRGSRAQAAGQRKSKDNERCWHTPVGHQIARSG